MQPALHPPFHVQQPEYRPSTFSWDPLCWPLLELPAWPPQRAIHSQGAHLMGQQVPLLYRELPPEYRQYSTWNFRQVRLPLSVCLLSAWLELLPWA